MWPFRPEKLTEILPREDLQRLLELGAGLGSALTLVEKGPEGTYVAIEQLPRGDATHRDPFCSFFRQGKVGEKLAFEGADEACAQCEQRFARRVLDPNNANPLPLNELGVAHLRCHMGLTDYLYPLMVGGKVLAALIGGRRVEEEDDRQRIRKTAGKLGKLTRAEAESAATSDKILIQPLDERCRDRLLAEIPEIPLGTDDFQRHLADLGKVIARLAERQYEGPRRALEDALVERVDSRHGELPRTFADLRRDAGLTLDMVRSELGVEYLAFFALAPRDMDQKGARPTLAAESGLELNTSKRLLELDWERFPPDSTGSRNEITRGLGAISSMISALVATIDAPLGLKDRLTKCMFMALVETGWNVPSALCYGSAQSVLRPEDNDYRFLARVARAVSRRYYALAAEVERRWISERLLKEEAARQEAEEARKASQNVVREMEAARKQEAQVRGFMHFDLRRLVDSCLERVRRLAEERKVEVDARALLDRAMYDGDRRRLGDAMEKILIQGIERTQADSESKKAAPLRVYLKRSRESLVFGVEAVGHYMEPEERRSLFAREERPARRSRGAEHGRERAAAPSEAAAETSPAAPASGISAAQPLEGNQAQKAPAPERAPAPAAMGGGLATFRDILAILRRHNARFFVKSERLHRAEGDPHRWIGKTEFVFDLPLSHRQAEDREAAAPPPEGKEGPPARGEGGAREGRRRRGRRPRPQRPEPQDVGAEPRGGAQAEPREVARAEPKQEPQEESKAPEAPAASAETPTNAAAETPTNAAAETPTNAAADTPTNAPGDAPADAAGESTTDTAGDTATPTAGETATDTTGETAT